MNRDVLDQVTSSRLVVMALYFPSPTLAVLSQGDSSVSNWHGSGLDMTIHVNQINLVSNPGFAQVTVALVDSKYRDTDLLTVALVVSTGIPTYFPTSVLTYKVR